jgi:hypothetical protein
MPNTSQYTKAIKNPDGSINWISLILFVIALSVFVAISYFVRKTILRQYQNTVQGEPWLVETTKSASSQQIFPGKSIPRSNDGKFGIEFSYSVWIYVDEWSDESRIKDETGQINHILHKGDELANPNQAPGIWLQRVKNDLRIVVKMNTFSTYTGCQGEACYLERCDIGNIPLNKWVHLTLVTINKNIDLYINGFLKKRCLLKGLPRQNDGDVYINSFGGFRGFLSRVRYFNYALPIWKIEQIMRQGPSTYVGPDISKAVPPYLAYNWWDQKFGIPYTNQYGNRQISNA